MFSSVPTLLGSKLYTFKMVTTLGCYHLKNVEIWPRRCDHKLTSDTPALLDGVENTTILRVQRSRDPLVSEQSDFLGLGTDWALCKRLREPILPSPIPAGFFGPESRSRVPFTPTCVHPGTSIYSFLLSHSRQDYVRLCDVHD